MTTPQTFRAHIGVPPSTASTHDSILVIIDAQNEYDYGRLAIANLPRTRPTILRLLERYRGAGGAIAHVVHIVPPGTPVFTPDTPLAAIFPELQPYEGEPIVEKRFPGSFAETNLREVVEKAGVRKIVLTGYMAHVCVSTTAREAHQLGYEVLVVEDAIGDRNIPGLAGKDGASGEDVSKIVMLELADLFATVVKSEDIQ
ncbi:Isochorismatase-like protein [Mycena capillaripes]|nr:Isochorismatase-like protein [Mycena capillaripes]